MRSRVKTSGIFLIFMMVFLMLVSSGYARDYSGQAKPEPFIIPGQVTVVFEDNVNLQGFAKGFSTVNMGIPSFDRLLDDFEVYEGRKLFPWYTEKPVGGPQRGDPTRFYGFSFPETYDVMEVIEALMQNPNVRLAEPVWALPLEASPNDPQWSNQWAMSPPPPDPYYYDAWDIETGSDSIKFACIDSGVNYKHEDLKDHIWINPGEDLDGDRAVYDADDLNGLDDDGNGVVDDLIGYDFLTGIGMPVWPGEDGSGTDTDPSDFNGHGTHVSGIAAAMTNNAKGVTGIAGGWHGGNRAFRGVEIMCIRIGALANDGIGYVNSQNCGTAISYAANNGAHVINCSWGSQFTATMAQGMQDAAANGVTVCHAAGNDNADDPDYLDNDPYTEVLSVAALGPYSDTKWSSSNYGTWVDVSAPGSEILSTSSEYGAPDYLAFSGTSMASPMVAGLALLIRSACPSLTKQQVDSLIINTADTIDYLHDPFYHGKLGSGRINAYNALVDLPSAKFMADVTEGNVPLEVNFTDLSPNSPVSWLWAFGTGDSSILQNPSFTYNDPGVYSVSLLVDEGNPLGLGEEHLKHYIWARADTFTLDSIRSSVNSKVVMPVYLAHTSQIKELQYSFQFTNTNDVSLDSISVAGLRTENFYDIDTTAFDPNNERYALKMLPCHPDSSQYMQPDTGAILMLYFQVSPVADPGLYVIDTQTVNGKRPYISTIWGEYWPDFYTPGIIEVPLCDHGDANCDGDVNVADLTALVDYLFRGGPPVDPRGGDANGDLIIVVSDVNFLVCHLFCPSTCPNHPNCPPPPP